jgi:hypothetical protein
MTETDAEQTKLGNGKLPGKLQIKARIMQGPPDKSTGQGTFSAGIIDTNSTTYTLGLWLWPQHSQRFERTYTAAKPGIGFPQRTAWQAPCTTNAVRPGFGPVFESS